VIVSAAIDPFDPSGELTFVIDFDQPMDQDGSDDPAAWQLNPAVGPPIVGASLSWDDAVQLRIRTGSFATPIGPFTGSYADPGPGNGQVRSAFNMLLATIAGFPVS